MTLSIELPSTLSMSPTPYSQHKQQIRLDFLKYIGHIMSFLCLKPSHTSSFHSKNKFPRLKNGDDDKTFFKRFWQELPDKMLIPKSGQAYGKSSINIALSLLLRWRNAG